MRTADIDVEITLFLHISIRFIIFSDGYHSSFLIVFIGSKKPRKPHEQRRKRAIILFACQSFAWFTSKDEVTNRLSASADYGAKIVESFAPPKNWIPGQKVDKDVYATNTGNIGAYVGMDISGALSIVKEVTVDPSTITTNAVSTTTHTITYNDGTSDVTLDLTDDYSTKVKGNQYCATGFNEYSDPNGTAYTIISDVSKTTTTTTDSDIFDCIELTNNERYAIEAGAYLAYKPAGDTINKVGDLAVTYIDDDAVTTTTYTYKAYKSGTTADNNLEEQDVTFDSTQTLVDNTETESVAYREGYTKKVTKGGNDYFVKEIAPTTTTTTTNKGDDFVPRAEGLYVFRRSIDVDAAGFPGDTTRVSKGAESFTYDAYYYFGGRYYKVVDLDVTPDDVADIAGDGVQTDGNLDANTAPTFNFVKEVTDYVDPVALEYDNANHRLIATYSAAKTGLDTALTTASQNLDTAEHNYAKAELALRRAIDDAASEDAQVRDLTTARDAAKAARDAAKADYDAKKAAFEALKQRYTEALTEFQGATGTAGARKEVADDIDGLVGTNGKIKIEAYDENDPKTLVERASTTGTVAVNSKAGEYNEAKQDYDDFVAAHTINPISNPGGTVEKIEHIYFTYLQELAANATAGGYTYSVPSTLTANSTKEALETAIKDAVAAIGYDKLKDFTPSADLHTYHALLTEYKLKTDNYEKALQEYVDDATKLNHIIDTLNDATPANPTTPLNNVDLTAANSSGDVSALNAENGKLYAKLQEAREAFDGVTIDPVNAAYGEAGGAAKALKDAEDALTQAESNLQNGTNKVTDNDDVKQNLENAWKEYYKAKNALYAAEQAKDAAQKKYDKNGDLKIYINLDNDVLVGGVGGKWQALPTTVTGNVAHFYYTNILEGGETTTKLVDSVELDKGVTQDMYKYFDFDVNVAMKSAQITYAEDNETITAEATPTNVGATATLAQPKNINTAITWSANP